jgi:hypothetical protein
MLSSRRDVRSVINARPGYWDVDGCSWVGVDPMYVMPLLRHADRPHDRSLSASDLPAPRAADDDETRVIDHESEPASPG